MSVYSLDFSQLKQLLLEQGVQKILVSCKKVNAILKKKESKIIYADHPCRKG